MKNNYLTLYKDWMKSGQIGNNAMLQRPNGLCFYFLHDELFELFHPTSEYIESLGDDYNAYWASGITHSEFIGTHEGSEISKSKFTDLRQNIVLLMAAMNGEL